MRTSTSAGAWMPGRRISRCPPPLCWRCAGDIAAGDRLTDAITVDLGARLQECEESAHGLARPACRACTSSQQVRPSQVVEDLHGPAARPRRRQVPDSPAGVELGQHDNQHHALRCPGCQGNSGRRFPRVVPEQRPRSRQSGIGQRLHCRAGKPAAPGSGRMEDRLSTARLCGRLHYQCRSPASTPATAISAEQWTVTEGGRPLPTPALPDRAARGPDHQRPWPASPFRTGPNTRRPAPGEPACGTCGSGAKPDASASPGRPVSAS